MYRKLSNGISWALHPFLLPLYMIGVLLTLTVFAHYPSGVKIYLLWVVALYAIIIPLLALGVLRSLGRISDYRIDDRRERLLPLLVGAVCYVLCAITIAKIPSAIFLRKFMIAAACCEVMCLVVSLYWKISLHLTAMGAVVALLVVMNIAGVGDMMVPLMIAILCAGALASARLYLGCHNGSRCWPDSAAGSPSRRWPCCFCSRCGSEIGKPGALLRASFVCRLRIRRIPAPAWRWQTFMKPPMLAPLT